MRPVGPGALSSHVNERPAAHAERSARCLPPSEPARSAFRARARGRSLLQLGYFARERNRGSLRGSDLRQSATSQNSAKQFLSSISGFRNVATWRRAPKITLAELRVGSTCPLGHARSHPRRLDPPGPQSAGKRRLRHLTECCLRRLRRRSNRCLSIERGRSVRPRACRLRR